MLFRSSCVSLIFAQSVSFTFLHDLNQLQTNHKNLHHLKSSETLYKNKNKKNNYKLLVNRTNHLDFRDFNEKKECLGAHTYGY